MYIVSAARHLHAGMTIDSKRRLLLAENELSRVSLTVSSFCRVLTIPAFFLGASASEESIKVANIACSTSQIKMATLRNDIAVDFRCLGVSLNISVI